MKVTVRDVIQDNSEFLPARSQTLEPFFSILWPSYRRRDGLKLFRSVMDSILTQSFKNFEIIIVDDASPLQAEEDPLTNYYKSDERISIIQHRENVGLPAISEYEAFMKSRGKYILFAFDDFIFEEKVFEKVYEYLISKPREIIFGKAYCVSNKFGVKLRTVYGDSDACIDRLNSGNSIANSSVAIHRDIINERGLYNPNIALARLCDWELWYRLKKYYDFNRIDVLFGVEYGVTREDSLGKTYPVSSDLTNFLINTKPPLLGDFQNYNILENPLKGNSLNEQIFFELKSFYAEKFWFKQTGDYYIDKNDGILAVYGRNEYSRFFYFDILQYIDPDIKIVYIEPSGNIYGDIKKLLRASSVVVVGDNISNALLIDLLYRTGIPLYCFINRHDIFFNHNRWNIFKGLFVATEELYSYIKEKSIHENVVLYRPVFYPELKPLIQIRPEGCNTIKIIFAGERSNSSFVRGIKKKFNNLPGYEIILNNGRDYFDLTNSDKNYEKIISELNKLNPDCIICCPDACGKYNIELFLFICYYLKVIPVLFEEYLTDEPIKEIGFIVSEKSISMIPEIISSAYKDEKRDVFFDKLKSYLELNYAYSGNISELKKILIKHEMSMLDYENRINSILDSMITFENAVFYLKVLFNNFFKKSKNEKRFLVIKMVKIFFSVIKR